MAEHTPIDAPEGEFLRPPSPIAEREQRLAILERFLTERRRRRVEATIQNRIGSLAVVIDGISDLGNASAIIRTADGLGLYRLFFVDRATKFKPAARTSQGSHNWMDMRRYEDPIACAKAVKAAGFKLAGTSLEATQTLEEMDFSQPIAIAVGAERDGLSPEMMEECDELFRIDMRGMAQSYNVSVAMALTLFHATRARFPDGVKGDLSAEAMDEMRDRFYRLAVNNADEILRQELGEAPPPVPELEGMLRLMVETQPDAEGTDPDAS